MMLAQRTFTEIKDYSRDRHHSKQTAAAAKRIFGFWTKCLERRAFNKWRVINYHRLVEQIAETKEHAGDNKDDFELKLARAHAQFTKTKHARKTK